MGLSASQARLLSITARLSDNELHSQQIANSKVRLADKTQEASREYIDALNTKKLMFTTFDAQGNSTNVSLTAAYLYDYAPLKNQYVLQDSNGTFMLSQEDISNYQKTDNILEFLECYGLLSDDKYKRAMEKYNEDLETYNDDLARYNSDKAKYDAEKSQYDNDILDYRAKLADYERQKADYDAAYQEWLKEKDKPQLYDDFAGFVGTSDNPNNDAGFCYGSALNGSSGCYKHLLAHLLDYAGGYNYNTNYDYVSSWTDPTTGQKATTQLYDTSGGMTGDVMNDPKWLEIVEAMKDSSRLCDGDDNFEKVNDGKKENIIQQALDEGREPTKEEILKSDYIYDEKTGKVTGIKSLRQKAIDLLYILNNNIPLSREEMRATLINFTDGDMRNLSSPPTPIDPFTEVPPLMPEAPVKPEPPTPPEYSVEINDRDKAQWYVNLWYMMNGSDTANLVKEDESTDLKGIFRVAAAEKVSKGNYKALDDNLLKSESWIRFALEHGIATFVQAQFMNPSEDSNKAVELNGAAITWLSTVYTSCADITEADDEVAIARAEAIYNKKLNEIEAKDKKYDNDIKKLDTEHNALQTEYESVKEVISKNVERSFKAFS